MSYGAAAAAAAGAQPRNPTLDDERSPRVSDCQIIHLSCALAAVSLGCLGLQAQTICEKYLRVPLAGQAG